MPSTRIAIIIAVLAGCSSPAPAPAAPRAGDAKPDDATACDRGNAQACVDLAQRYTTGQGVAKDEAKALALLVKACELKDGRACNNVGVAWSEGKEGAPAVDHAKAKLYYDKACKLDHGLGCFNFGNIYRLGEGVAVDLKLAFDNFKRSCELDEAKGCTELAILYYEGNTVAKDVAQATALLDKACKLGSEAACKNLELLRGQKP